MRKMLFGCYFPDSELKNHGTKRRNLILTGGQENPHILILDWAWLMVFLLIVLLSLVMLT